MAKTRIEWEKEFIVALIRLRDYFLQLEGSEQSGLEKSKAINNLVLGYFSERRGCVGIPEVSCYTTNEEMAFYINDIVLEFITDEHVGFLETDWQNRYILKSEEDDIYSDSYDEDEDNN